MSFILSVNPRNDKKARNEDFRVFSIEGRIKTGKMIELLRHKKTEEENKREKNVH